MPLTQNQLRRHFGAFSYKKDSRKNGAVIIDDDWVRSNIVRFNSPYGKFPCHKKVLRQMKGLVYEAHSQKLIHDIGGIWVPRHTSWDCDLPLSGHAYGCEIDINVPLGKDGLGGALNIGANSYQPPALIDIAKGWGFEWGGAWRHNKDGMHFSCVSVGKISPSCTLSKLGDSGGTVKFMQNLLKGFDISLVADGEFGQLTRASVVSFQKSRGLEADGIVGPKTWRSLLS